MTTTQLPANTIAAHSAKLAGTLGYTDGLLIILPGSAMFVADDQPLYTGIFVPLNRNAWATLDDNGDVLVPVRKNDTGESFVVRTSGCSTELQKLGVFTYRNGERLDFSEAV